MDAAREQLAAAALAALRGHAPFDSMDGDSMRYLAARLELAYYAPGARIAGPHDRAAEHLLIVKHGRVRGGDEVLEAGECFPVESLVAARPPAVDYVAEGDCFAWQLPAAAFHALIERSREFRAFCTDRLALLLERSQRARRAEAAARHLDGAGLLAPLRSALGRAPVSCGPHALLGEVIRTMKAERVGAMVVVDPRGAPLGIFTTQDVLDRVAATGTPPHTPVAQVMSRPAVALEQEATLLDAALAMVERRIRHVVVTRDGMLAGVLSERDLFALQRLSLRRASERIAAAADTAALAAAAQETHALVAHLLAQGVGAEALTQVATALNDALSRRAIELAAARHALPGRWCWLALGSEGRLEQTALTDQDNALIFVPEGDVAPARRACLAFADEVNRALDAAGFPLCKGDIMARNPRWCLTPDEWRAVFGDWIRNPLPEALLNASIFFDFRALAGEARLAGELREAMLRHARVAPAFCRAMAHNALQVRPPLGVLRDFVTDDGMLDLKAFGARPFVDAARVLALAAGSAETSTAARLRAAGEPAAVEAFHFVQGLRLENGGNRLRVDGLSALDRRALKEALRQAAALQERLRLDYP